MIKRKTVFLESHHYGLADEEKAIKSVLADRYDIVEMSDQKFMTRQDPFKDRVSVLVSGSIGFVETGLKKLGVTLEPINCYPDSVKEYLNRNVSLS